MKPYTMPNVGVQNVTTYGFYVANVPLGPNSFMLHGSRPTNDGPNSAYGPSGREFRHNAGHYSDRSMGQHYGDGDLGHPYGGMAARVCGQNGTGQNFGPSGSVRPHPNNGQISSRPNASCVNLDRSLQNTTPEVPWRIKS